MEFLVGVAPANRPTLPKHTHFDTTHLWCFYKHNAKDEW